MFVPARGRAGDMSGDMGPAAPRGSAYGIPLGPAGIGGRDGPLVERILAEDGARGRRARGAGVPRPGVGDLSAPAPGAVRAASAARTSGGRDAAGLSGKGMRAEPEELVGETGESRLGRVSRASGLGTRSGRLSEPLRALSDETDERVRVREEEEDWAGGAGLFCRAGRCCWARADLRGELWAGGGLLTRLWSFVGRRAATERGDWGGLRAGICGTGGTGAQTWSPRSAILTGWLQVEHFTVGRIWDMRSEPGAGAMREAIKGV